MPSFNSLRSRLSALLHSPSLPPDDLASVRQMLEELNALEAEREAEAEALREMLKQADEARAKFVSIVSHELKLPMTSIKGYGDLMRQGLVGPVNEQQVQFLEIIRNNVDRMSTLVSDISDGSKLETGRLKLDLAEVDPAECACGAADGIRGAAEAKGQTLELNLEAGLPALQTDRMRLTQILGKLLDNAHKYTPSGGHIRLDAAREGDAVRFAVRDTGIGIGPEDRARLFEQFFRAEAPAVREHAGWGLSLHLCKRLVELMGGQMGVESEAGKGSTFWFSLPLAK